MSDKVHSLTNTVQKSLGNGMVQNIALAVIKTQVGTRYGIVGWDFEYFTITASTIVSFLMTW